MDKKKNRQVLNCLLNDVKCWKKSIENLVTNSTLVLLPSVVRVPFNFPVKNLKMVAIKFLVLLTAISGASMANLMPQAILQLLQSKYGERPVLIEVFYTSKTIKILDETLKLLGGVKQLKVTPINITDIISMGEPMIEPCVFNPRMICPRTIQMTQFFCLTSSSITLYGRTYINTHNEDKHFCRSSCCNRYLVKKRIFFSFHNFLPRISN